MRKAIISSAALVFAVGSLFAPTVNAGIVTTSGYLDREQVAEQRADIIENLQREEVQEQLVDMGVDPAVVEARVAALSPEEVAALHADMDELPAGADISNTTLILLIILIVLLI